MTFKPGVSGNPNGRPKTIGASVAEMMELARSHAPLAFKVLLEIASGKHPAAARVQACTVLLDRGYGRPMQHTEISAKDGVPLFPTLNITMEPRKAIEKDAIDG